MSDTDFLPTASWQNLKLRAETLKRLRAFFDARGFVEVETPLLSHDTVIDRHLDPIPVTLFNDPREVTKGPTLYLQTSPEFGMKRLLAAGEAQAIYQITRAFRGAEWGAGDYRNHNPEFTILEWYRVGDDYQAGMQLLAELATHMFDAPEALAISYRDAFRQFVGVDPFVAQPSELHCAALEKGIGVPYFNAIQYDRDMWLNVILGDVVIPELGKSAPTILYDYPATQSALAKTRMVDGVEVAERFELFYKGVELANGYHELLDADLLAERNRTNNAARQSDRKYTLPEQSRLLDAMNNGLPACSGCALGVDRLVMLLAGAERIQDVMAFPIDRA